MKFTLYLNYFILLLNIKFGYACLRAPSTDNSADSPVITEQPPATNSPVITEQPTTTQAPG